MGPGLRGDLALHLLLDPVVADGLRSVHCSVEILLGDFADRARRILRRVPEPRAGVAVSLQLEPDRRRRGSRPLSAALHPLHGADQVLDVMAELVGQDVRLGSVAALRPKLARQLVKESEIKVDRGVGWTVEGSDR